jgi:hypothetical protein
MVKPMLNDPDIYPEEGVLAGVLGTSFPVFKTCMAEVTGAPLMLNPEWRYYKDGHAWLCKVTHKKKTVFWLSAWEGFFKITFYFTEKSGTGLQDLGISPELLEKFQASKPIGKLIPLTMVISRKEQLGDLISVAGYKKKLN